MTARYYIEQVSNNRRLYFTSFGVSRVITAGFSCHYGVSSQCSQGVGRGVGRVLGETELARVN